MKVAKAPTSSSTKFDSPKRTWPRNHRSNTTPSNPSSIRKARKQLRTLRAQVGPYRNRWVISHHTWWLKWNCRSRFRIACVRVVRCLIGLSWVRSRSQVGLGNYHLVSLRGSVMNRPNTLVTSSRTFSKGIFQLAYIERYKRTSMWSNGSQKKSCHSQSSFRMKKRLRCAQ